MSRKKTHRTKQFKLDAINYRKEHPDLTQIECVNILAHFEPHVRILRAIIP